MHAIISEIKKHPTKTLDKSSSWELTYQPEEEKVTDNLMGWIGSGDTKQQLKIQFESLAAAKRYADRNNIAYTVKPLAAVSLPRKVTKSYLDIYNKDL